VITVDKLQGNSSLHKIVSVTNELIDTVNSSMGILRTLDNSSLGEILKYTASDDADVTGEVYTVEIPGLYKIKTIGSGIVSVLIQKHGESEVSGTLVLYTDQESEEVLLSSNDKLLFYVTSTRNTYSVSLTLTKGLFSVTQEMLDVVKSNNILLNELKSQISTSIESYTKEYEELTKANRDLQNFTNEQLTLMNDTIKELSDKITELSGRI
jgi:hypothetical protein